MADCRYFLVAIFEIKQNAKSGFEVHIFRRVEKQIAGEGFLTQYFHWEIETLLTRKGTYQQRKFNNYGKI